MQTQSQRFIKWVPKKQSYIQQNPNVPGEDRFLKSVEKMKLEREKRKSKGKKK